MQNQNKLVLEIFKQAQSLKMSLFKEAEIASTLRHYSQCNVSFEEIRSLCKEVFFLLNKASKSLIEQPELERSLVKAGQLLWNQLLTKQVRDKLRLEQGSGLVLSIDEELIDVPWEILYDGDNFLCLNFSLGRLVRTKRESIAVQYRSFSSILKMLILANPTNDLKGAYEEGLSIRNQFDRKRNSVHIDFKSTYIDKIYTKKNICDYDIVHFAGHCEHDLSNPQNTGWILADGLLTSQDIESMASFVSMPSLVFSNACYSASGNQLPCGNDYQENNYNLAAAFLFSGVRHYIGSIRKIEDKVSFTFAKEFYTQLLSGVSIGECVRLGRLKLVRDYGIGKMHWTNYLLYGDPNFVLFRDKANNGIKQEKSFIFLRKNLLKISLGLVAAVICIFMFLFLPEANPSTLYLFSKSKKSYLSGRNQEVIRNCKRIIEKNSLFLKAYPLLADSYFRLGEIEQALKYYFDYALYSEKKGQSKDLIQAYIGIGWTYYLSGQPQKALEFYNQALIKARQEKDSYSESVAMRKLAVWNMDIEEYDKALELLIKCSEIDRSKSRNFEHRYNLACDYFDLGLVFSDKNDYATAKEFYSKSLGMFKKMKLKNELSDYYFNIGEIYLFEKQYQKALDCYAKGFKIDELQGNKMNLASDYNMIGELYFDMDKFSEAQESFNRSVSVSRQIKVLPELASGLRNLGFLFKKTGKKNKAKEYFRQAQEIFITISNIDYQEMKKELVSLNAN
ncbi:MAG: tetratricopeptide repeat protein [Candidatus Omnitrophica bacterium]|nr:tetratricopeptide repeat protein [Candidatus Omnitrophota bacterium]